jgi:alkanesulfonate monooxygenase SsuD/methylene tetrahydromethanopterin reductase-like flavin-dependent oxidoreductase (luciferase family)
MVGCASDDAGIAGAREAVRTMIAFYGSTPAYRPVLDFEGYGDLHTELHALVAQGRWADIPALVTDDLVDRIAVIGTPAQVAAGVRKRCDGIADRVCLAASRPIAMDDLTELVSTVGM